MKKQVKKYVGWVEEGEKLKDTIDTFFFTDEKGRFSFGMLDHKNIINPIKRTITITSEDEDGSTKTRKAKKKGKKKTIASSIVNKKSR